MQTDDHDLLIRIHENVKQLQREVLEHYTEVVEHWRQTDERVSVQEAWRWKILGAAVAVSVMASTFGAVLVHAFIGGQ